MSSNHFSPGQAPQLAVIHLLNILPHALRSSVAFPTISDMAPAAFLMIFAAFFFRRVRIHFFCVSRILISSSYFLS